MFSQFDAKAVDLHRQHILVAIHREAGKSVRVPEDDPGAGQILPHNDLPVPDRPLNFAPPEILVYDVIGVGGDGAEAKFGVGIVKPCGEITVLFAVRITDTSVRNLL